MHHINNLDRFNQHLDFSTFPAFATDIDGLIHAKGKCWLFLEAKTEGNGMPMGQEIFAKDLVQTIGFVKPVFFAVAHHDTRASEAITGDNLMVSKVYASAPWMKGKVMEHTYTHRPTWRNFSSDILMMTGATRVIRKGHENYCEGGETGDIKDKVDEYLWKAMANEHLMKEYADLDCVDKDDMSEELWAFIESFGFTETPETEGNIVLLFDALVFQNWMMNRP